MHQTDPSQGELSFELLAEIAVGSTARVELCRVVDGPLKRELVAVKRLHPHIADDPLFVDMFRDEVWMTAALKHRNVVEVVGWGQDSVGPWLAVEFVKGVSLQRLMKTVFETGEKFTERMVVYLALCICDGLATAHSLCSAQGEHLNLVHRDLTPGNILLGFDGHVKITDFGLAKAKQRLTKTLTGLLKGQPQYMSPEQVRGGQLDGRSDIFAVGVVLFELFSGRRPWLAATDLDAMRAITDEPADDLAELRPRIDKALVEIVSRCLEKAPESRYQNAVELRDRFDGWLNAHGYRNDNHVSLARFVRRNAMRQMRWFERAIAGEFIDDAHHNQPAPSLYDPPDTPHMAAPASSARTNPRQDPRRTLDERAPTSRDVPQPRREAITQVDERPNGARRPQDSIDWGEDGPTLIQKSESAKLAIERARQQARMPEGDTTRRARHDKPIARRPGITDAPTALRGEPVEEDSSDHETTPGRRADIDHALETARRRVAAAAARGAAADGTGATVAMGEVGENVQSLMREPGVQHPDVLGIVAPPDPDVPPLPPSQHGSQLSSPQAQRSPHGSPPPPPQRHRAATAPLRAPREEVRLAASPSSSGLRSSPSAAEVYAQSDPVEGTRPMQLQDLANDEPSFSPPVGPGREPTGSDQALRMPLGAMPAPRFPSLPSMVGERTKDFNGEAQRLGAAARSAGEYAEAAARAARLAGQAALAAADGQRATAIVLLRDAQHIEDALARGEIPRRQSIDLTATSGDLQLLSRVTALGRRELATLLLAVAVGLLAVGLLIALFV